LLFLSNTFAEDGKKTDDENLRRSLLDEPTTFGTFGPFGTSYPVPFDRTDNDKEDAAISTGYYFVHSGDLKAAPPLRPDYSFLDTTEDALNWKRILSGPNQREMSEWVDENGKLKEEGYRFFRDPYDDDWSLATGGGTDSTDNAIAGPIPIGFDFMFNGLVYDSFYVSTNGGIILSNARYVYNDRGDSRVENGNDYTDPEVPNCYNVMSGDWFSRSQNLSPGASLTDPTVDDWGFQAARYVSNQGTGRPDLLTQNTRRPPIIAPFWGNGHLSQWDPENEQPRDRGKVYFHKGQNKTIIYFVGWQLKGNIYYTAAQYVAVNAPDALTPADNNYVGGNVQIVLDRADNSITFNYERFQGHISAWSYYAAKELIRYNTHCGVFGYARHQGYDSKLAQTEPDYTWNDAWDYEKPWADQYFQHTFCWSRFITRVDVIPYPENTQTVKFVQWKNTLRVVDLAFRVRPQVENSPDYTEEIPTLEAQDYEILAGHDQVGQLQPVAIVENLSNDIMGPGKINFQAQDLSFRLRLAIINQATRRPLYNRYVQVDSSAIGRKSNPDVAYEKVILSSVTESGGNYEADTMDTQYYTDPGNVLLPEWNGIPPYGFVQVYFPPFEPNDLYLSNIGLMKAFIMADPTDPRTGEGIGDMWPFDDTMNVRFWVMRHIGSDESFLDDVREFHIIPVTPPGEDFEAPVAIPSVFKWVSVGATVVKGEEVSHNPLPPRGEYLCENDEVYPGEKRSSPTIKIDRGAVPMNAWGGGEIRSFPINMLEKEGSVLTLAVQRSTKKDDWERGWSDGQIVGCEHRVVIGNWYRVARTPDEIRVEFARPSPRWEDGTFITNIAKANWRWHLRREGAATEKNMSAYSLFGGGGYMVGFLESDPDSAMLPPNYGITTLAENGLRADLFDDGIDFEYKKLFVPIPDTFINAEADGAKYFRFRVQVYAKNNRASGLHISDDEDPFYVDNVRILYAEDEDVDIEISKVAAEWPYTLAPASQAVAIPIRISMSNNTSRQAPSFWVKGMIVRKQDFDQAFFLDDAWVYRGSPDDDDYEDMLLEFAWLNQQARDSARKELLHHKPIYCRVKQMPFLRPGAVEPVTMPNWNARLSPQGDYVVVGVVYVPGGDLEARNDTTYSSVNIKFGPIFAYHPIVNATNWRQAENNVAQMSGEYGRGLTLRGYKMGGVGGRAQWNTELWELGDPGGDGGSGNFAMKFELVQEDTIFGYAAFFDRKNMSPDYTAYKMFDSPTGGDTPGNEIPNSLIESRRGDDDVLDTTGLWEQFVSVTLPKPLVLPKGTYWVTISQLGETGIELGASKSRVGMRSTSVYYSNPQTPPGNGSGGLFLNLEKSFRERSKYGTLLNKNFFAFENGSGSGAWEQFMATQGNPSYAHLDHTGEDPMGQQPTQTWSRGAWMPLLVPYLKDRTFASTPEYLECDVIPVELAYFKGAVRQGTIDLVWETASEVDNYGFHVERRIVGDETNEWNTLPQFVQGNGTSNIPHEYNYVDDDVIPNTTYQYKLRQVDFDGTQSCDDFSNIVTLTYKEKGSVVLMPNKPNPFNNGTALNFTIPESSYVTLEILDIYGNVVTTLVDESLSAGTYTKQWMSENSSGSKVASGTYIYRLRVGDEIQTGKMSLIK
ncbi:FlgD immunoglobulin-like domain containing protein, partial [Bacteroidota bacterium]